ncbi:MAG: isoquinoline 1-oxidoreductase subunit beta, partial [Solirubrobacteraceae bacterium]|nr:isoquinoline 1-oxidoreductase subunit beta [Solirubrobacteraceae bacterium]
MVDLPQGRVPDDDAEGPDEGGGITRRRMVGYLIAGPTIMSGVTLTMPGTAQAAGSGIPTVQLVDSFDLSDALRASYKATAENIKLTANDDGTVSFELHRSENGQGITTTFAMIIADELDLP